MKHFIIIFFSLLGLNCFAQEYSDAKSINAIKSDTTYLYGEATNAEIGKALTAAKTSLEVRVSEWINSINTSEGIEVCIAKAKERCLEIKAKRGSLFRILVYVKKSDILPVADKSEVVVIKVNSPNDKSEPVSGKPLVVEQEVNDTPEKETETEPEVKTSPVVDQKSDVIVKPRPDIKLTNEEKKMVSITNKEELEFYLKSINAMRKIRKGKHGKSTTLPKEENCHLFVYSKNGNNVLAVFRKEGTVLLNLKEAKEDDLSNYENYELFWFQLR